MALPLLLGPSYPSLPNIALPFLTCINEVVDALLAGHLKVVAAAKADVMVLLQVLDVQDHATLVTAGP